MKKHIFFSLLVFTGLFSLKAQEPIVFTQDQLVRNLLEYHPVARQARLITEAGSVKVRKARGAFDPYLYGYLDEKQFNQKQYYQTLNTGLEIPTWFGIEVKAGLERTSGIYLNPENNTPDEGLVYAGVSVPLGQGLFIDERRKTLRQAQIYASATEVEQQTILNDLIFDASVQYWEWVQAWNQVNVLTQAVELAEISLDAVRESYRQGDKAAIDTLEALIQLQTLKVNLNETQVNYYNHTLGLSGFLWGENNVPLDITDGLVPPLFSDSLLLPPMSLDSVVLFIEQIPERHPDIRLYDYKMASLEIEKRWKKEQLKPELDLKYQLLSEPVGDPLLSPFSTQNYKWGLSLSFPVFLRKTRSDLQLVNINMQETQLSRSEKSLLLKNKAESYANQITNLFTQINLFSVTVANYEKMLEAERQKFDIGESNLFLINSRLNKLIEARLKLLDLKVKYQKSSVSLLWALGMAGYI
ncbi:MAG: TolC family protein [Bacteroidia bacterium]|nr:TolC family protein [Bacteroidia bacterium]